MAATKKVDKSVLILTGPPWIRRVYLKYRSTGVPSCSVSGPDRTCTEDADPDPAPGCKMFTKNRLRICSCVSPEPAQIGVRKSLSPLVIKGTIFLLGGAWIRIRIQIPAAPNPNKNGGFRSETRLGSQEERQEQVAGAKLIFEG
jgi:hypothetical protein